MCIERRIKYLGRALLFSSFPFFLRVKFIVTTLSAYANASRDGPTSFAALRETFAADIGPMTWPRNSPRVVADDNYR